jgi:hypothetical protein
LFSGLRKGNSIKIQNYAHFPITGNNYLKQTEFMILFSVNKHLSVKIIYLAIMVINVWDIMNRGTTDDARQRKGKGCKNGHKEMGYSRTEKEQRMQE